MKTNKDLIIEPNAAIEGRKYSEEKPWSCKYCYWWGGKKKGCNLKQCHYLLPEKKKAVKTTPCGGCPYGKHVPCIELGNERLSLVSYRCFSTVSFLYSCVFYDPEILL